MKKILFICHGNVGRSPMAEFTFKDLVKKHGLQDEFEISSAGTSKGAAGISMDPRAKGKLTENGVPCKEHYAMPMTDRDYDDYDMLICMDMINIRDLYRMTDNDPEEKISMLLDFTDRKGEEIADPWYTGDFDATWRDIIEGCKGLLDYCQKH